MRINWNDSRIHYCGRMEIDPEKDGIRWVYAASSAYLCFEGTKVSVEAAAESEWWDIYLGVIIDGVQKKLKLSPGDSGNYTIADNLDPQKIHELVIFKRMDTANLITIKGFELPDDSIVYDANRSGTFIAREMGIGTDRRIEFFGDSVSCGEVSEAVLFTGREDPSHNGEFSNSWYSYAWMTARKLHAEIHDTSQGGIALMDGTGWYHEPEADGMESFFNKCQSNKHLAPVSEWDFTQWIPQIVVIAIGQNDSHPEDFMKNSPDGYMAGKWKERYAWFIRQIKKCYPIARVICTTTILNHDPSWDEAIDEVVECFNDSYITHFLYSKNGSGTPGHVRISEADEMSDELASYISIYLSNLK